VVFPEPMGACAIKSLCGGFRINGKLRDCILLGKRNFISMLSPFRSSGERDRSSKVGTDVTCTRIQKP